MSKENDDKAARKGTGSVAGIALGTTAFLAAAASATEMTSGLALVGSLVDGGMAAGIGLVAAAPLAAGGLFYGAYKLTVGLSTPPKKKGWFS